MEIKFKGNSFIAEKSDFDNSQAKLMVLECRDCAYFSKNTDFNINCVKCILNAVKQYKNLKFLKISLKYQEKLFGSGEIGDLKSYFLNQEKVIKELTKINSFNKCKYKEFECKIIDSLRYDIFDLKKFIDDPIHFYDKLNEIKNLINTDKIYDSVCENCLVKLEVHLNKIIEILHKFHIIKDYIEFKSESNLNNRTRFYQQLFQKDSIKSKNTIQKTDNFLNNKKIATYNIGNRNEYEICIFEIKNESEKFYEYNLNLPQKFNGKYLKSLINDINLNFELIDINEIIQFEELLEIYRSKALGYIKHKYRISDNEASRLALYASLRRLNLFKIFPFLIDDFVEEIFLDSPYEKVYLIHQKYGKCRTNISFNDTEVERMKTFIRIYSNQRLDYSSPSNKLVIKNKLFYCRFALDISPIVPNGFALDIRKLNKNIMTIQDLLKNDTLTPEMAAFIYFNVLRRVNFTVTGETNTGKTTLINALDLITPREFRKIYIEDITESINQLKYGRHQLKFRVDSGDYSNQKFSKQNQIKNLLHRTPDIIYLGEILTKDEAKAMFHCLASGLKGFQTIHANDLEALINRFLFHFKIDRSCLSDLDLLILMKNSKSQRKIVSISEVDKDNIHINEIFSYMPHLKKHKLKADLFESKIINKLSRYEDIGKESFFSVLNVYKDIFSTLKKIKKINNVELVKLFDIISYLSFKSNQNIEKFWLNWKQRNLNPLN